jgi:hypothetical protein
MPEGGLLELDLFSRPASGAWSVATASMVPVRERLAPAPTSPDRAAAGSHFALVS